VLVQITLTMPLRRTILQFSQIRLTLALTFMTKLAFTPVYDSDRRIDEYIKGVGLTQVRGFVG
jgi:hypothetical protein